MEHAVLGAGAIGGLVGTAVASLGEGVTVLVRPERLPGYPANLSVERPSGAITALAKVAATLPNPVDVLWIATKTYQLRTALQAVQSLPRCIVPLLNGVDHVEVYAHILAVIACCRRRSRLKPRGLPRDGSCSAPRS